MAVSVHRHLKDQHARRHLGDHMVVPCWNKGRAKPFARHEPNDEIEHTVTLHPSLHHPSQTTMSYNNNNSTNFSNPQTTLASTQRRQWEEPGTVVVPDESDCIFGRGTAISNHQGNKRLHFLVQSYEDQYVSATTRSARQQVIEAIYNRMRVESGRFVRMDQTTGVCFVVSHSEAREKIRHAMRYYLRSKNDITEEVVQDAPMTDDNSNHTSSKPQGGPDFAQSAELQYAPRKELQCPFSDEELESVLGLTWHVNLPDLSAVAFLFLVEAAVEPGTRLPDTAYGYRGLWNWKTNVLLFIAYHQTVTDFAISGS